MSKRSDRRRLLENVRARISNRERWRAAFTRNLALKALSLVIAFALWLFVNFGERDTEAAVQVPLELRNIPNGLVVTGPRVDSIDLRLIGPRTLLGRVDRDNLSIDLDLQGVRPGPAVFSVDRDRLNLPRGVRVVRINPAQVTLELERMITKSLPVELRIGSPPSSDFTISQTGVVPDQVTVTGPASAVRDMDVVETDPVNLNDANPGRIERSVTLQPGADGTVLSLNAVMVQIEIADIAVTHKFDDAPVQVRAPSGRAAVRPQTVAITVEGPKRLLRGLAEESIVAWVEVPEQGPSSLQVEPVVALPAGVRLVNMIPRQVAVQLLAAAPTPTAPATGSETE